ncbi:MAG: hypothetical protein AAB614_02700 [Patescibacteria group bacterium]
MNHQSKIKIRKKNKISKAIFTFVIFSVGIFFFTIFQILDMNDMRYEKTEKLKLIDAIEVENGKLDIQLTKLKNSQNLKESALGLDMVDVAMVSYVNVGGDNVVFNR